MCACVCVCVRVSVIIVISLECIAIALVISFSFIVLAKFKERKGDGPLHNYWRMRHTYLDKSFHSFFSCFIVWADQLGRGHKVYI